MKLSYWSAPILVKKSIEKTIEDVCEHFKVSEDDVKTKSRKAIYCEPRAIICYLLRTQHDWKWERISEMFSRTHATAIHHNNRVAGFMEVNKEYRELVNSFK